MGLDFTSAVLTKRWAFSALRV